MWNYIVKIIAGERAKHEQLTEAQSTGPGSSSPAAGLGAVADMAGSSSGGGGEAAGSEGGGAGEVSGEPATGPEEVEPVSVADAMGGGQPKAAGEETDVNAAGDGSEDERLGVGEMGAKSKPIPFMPLPKMPQIGGSYPGGPAMAEAAEPPSISESAADTGTPATGNAWNDYIAQAGRWAVQNSPRGRKIVGALDTASDISNYAGGEGKNKTELGKTFENLADALSGTTRKTRPAGKREAKKTLFDRRYEDVYGGSGGMYGSLS
jgi:hypothetical protein